MSITTNTGGNEFLTRISTIKTVDDCKALYNDWAQTYNDDLTGPIQDYVAPKLVAQAISASNDKIKGEILDAGCGTGLVAVALSQLGAKNIDGVDLSPGILEQAKNTGVYRHLSTADLSKQILEKADSSYDVVTCVGTLTHGHVGPVPALSEFVRVVKDGGVIVATVLDDIWASGGYEDEVERLREEGKVDVVSTESADYRRGVGVKARLLILRKK